LTRYLSEGTLNGTSVFYLAVPIFYSPRRSRMTPQAMAELLYWTPRLLIAVVVAIGAYWIWQRVTGRDADLIEREQELLVYEQPFEKRLGITALLALLIGAVSLLIALTGANSNLLAMLLLFPFFGVCILALLALVVSTNEPTRLDLRGKRIVHDSWVPGCSYELGFDQAYQLMIQEQPRAPGSRGSTQYALVLNDGSARDKPRSLGSYPARSHAEVRLHQLQSWVNFARGWQTNRRLSGL